MADCRFVESTFGATATERDGRRMLHVEGTSECPTTGYSLELEADDPGVVPDPEAVVLRLVEHPPEVGEEVITPTRVSYDAEIGREPARVVIRVADAEPLSIPIAGATTAAEPHRPNSFQLSSDDGIEVTYQETSITGEPQFTYRDGSREISKRGDEIRREETSIGTLVAIELEAVPDFQAVVLSLVIPGINLRDGDAEFETLAIETTTRTTIGPGMITGPLQSYRTRTLRGTARFHEELGSVANQQALQTSTPTSESKGETMNGNNMRETVWNPGIWAEIDGAVKNAVGQVRVAQKVFAATSLPDAAVVPDDQLDTAQLRVQEGRTKPLLEISGEFPLTQSQTANESNLRTGKALAQLTAKGIGRLEDALFFQGKSADVPQNFDVLNKDSADGGLLGVAKTKIKVSKKDGYPESIFKSVVDGISELDKLLQPGPYALFLEPGIFADAHTPNSANVTPADRIKPLVTGGFYSTGTLLIRGKGGAADTQRGLLVSLGGEPTALYVGHDPFTEVTQSDVRGNLRFRVFERVQIVARDPQALVAFEFN
jgi:uncharacterized linocin/CFP29 family protein